MALEDTLMQVQENLRKGLFPNEAAVSTGAVLPILNDLGWQVFNPSVVTPEFTVEGRRVDYALCRSNGQPVVFLEVKRVGRADRGERQLFEYAFHRGVPLAVLTDGQEWNFYLPAGEGDYQDRRVYKLDLLERDLSECCYRLSRYLSHEDISSSAAFENAQSDYRDVNREREIERILPQAWDMLISEADDQLLKLLADKVADLCGYKPGAETCADFLSSIAGDASSGQPNIPAPPIPQQNRGQTGFVFRGQRHECRNHTEVMVEVFEKLVENDSLFPEKFEARRHGRSRRYLARDKYELYPGNPDLCEGKSHQLTNGWFISTHWNSRSKIKIVQLACEVAGLEFGKDLAVNFG